MEGKKVDCPEHMILDKWGWPFLPWYRQVGGVGGQNVQRELQEGQLQEWHTIHLDDLSRTTNMNPHGTHVVRGKEMHTVCLRVPVHPPERQTALIMPVPVVVKTLKGGKIPQTPLAIGTEPHIELSHTPVLLPSSPLPVFARRGARPVQWVKDQFAAFDFAFAPVLRGASQSPQ